MPARGGEFEHIRLVLEEADPDEGLTAREILRLLEEHGEEFGSPHRVATVLGRRADTGEIEVVRDEPYRYRLVDPSRTCNRVSNCRLSRLARFAKNSIYGDTGESCSSSPSGWSALASSYSSSACVR
jgi:hypothetical protein